MPILDSVSHARRDRDRNAVAGSDKYRATHSGTRSIRRHASNVKTLVNFTYLGYNILEIVDLYICRHCYRHYLESFCVD